MIKIIFAQIFLILSLTIQFFTQTAEKKPILIDEFGAENDETVMARTDSALISSGIDSFSNNPDARLRIRISGGVNKYYSTSYSYASRLSGYFRKNRGIISEKFSVDFCRTDGKFKIQFYSYSADQEFPKCPEELESPGKTTLFDRVSSDFPQLRLIPADTYFFDIGPSEGEYSKFALDALSKLLKKHPSSKVIVIGYLNANGNWNSRGKLIIRNENVDKKAELSKIFARTKNLLKQNGIEVRRIQFIDGGYMSSSKQLEFWFMPKGGKMPKPKPTYFPERKHSK